jgi:1,4-alpha-glucan branching enzyme
MSTSLRERRVTMRLIKTFYLCLVLVAPSMALAAPLCTNVFKAPNRFSVKDHTRNYKVQGANVTKEGVHFSIWAPNAETVEVVTELDGWRAGLHLMTKDNSTGIWSGFVVGGQSGLKYKYRILDAKGNIQFRNDPYARSLVKNEQSGVWDSVVSDPSSYHWQAQNFKISDKMRIMEVNARTRVPQNPNVNFRELAHHLLPILKESNVNTVSMMPVSHHNVVESWGYQPGGIYAVNYRHGSPEDLKYFIDYMHQNGIAVMFDVVLGHASKDWDTGLGGLDGTQLYFPEAPHLGEHKDWGTYIYNFRRNEVQDFLLSNVKYWAEEFKIDGIRVDGVTSMLFLDYSRDEYEKALIWKEFGTNKNLAAVEFLKKMNSELKKDFPHFVTIAEESSGWPGVTRSVKEGGLGFDYMWGMGAMHDMRSFLQAAPQDRDLNKITAPDSWKEKFIYYVNSHDETAHGKQRYIEQINGASGTDKKFDVSRVVTMWMYTMRGRPMLFQGDEIADPRGWSHNLEVQEQLKQYAPHASFEKYVHDLGELHEKEPAFNRLDEGSFKVLNVDNVNKILTVARFGAKEEDTLVIVLNFGATTMSYYRLPVPYAGDWNIVFDSDASYFGGTGTQVQLVHPKAVRTQQFPLTNTMRYLPAYSAIVLKRK